MSLWKKIRRHGIAGSAQKVITRIRLKSGWAEWCHRNAPTFANPLPDELEIIERDLISLGVTIYDYTPSLADFKAFQDENWFHAGYHGGVQSGVWDEKLLEHWISSERLGLMNYASDDVFVDVAAANSPWTKSLRERKGLSAYSIDLCEVDVAYSHLPYYRVENATQTSFDDASVKGVSLHCAYEMFLGEDDICFIHELARILQPGGKVIILPLYMHTHYCAYSTLEYFDKGHSDPDAKEYIRRDCLGIPSSRKYDAAKLKQRVLDTIEDLGLHYQLLALRNKDELGDNIYCHFVLEITR